MSEVGHPRYGLAVLLLLLTGQSGLYRFYLGRSGSAVVMAGSLLLALAVFMAAPSRFTIYLTISVMVILTIVVFIDLFRMSTLVKSARTEKLNTLDQPIVPEQKV